MWYILSTFSWCSLFLFLYIPCFSTVTKLNTVRQIRIEKEKCSRGIGWRLAKLNEVTKIFAFSISAANAKRTLLLSLMGKEDNVPENKSLGGFCSSWHFPSIKCWDISQVSWIKFFVCIISHWFFFFQREARKKIEV